jgi:hypothetical protein
VANLVAYYAMKERAREFGMTPDMLAKNELVIDGGLKSLEICKRHGIKVGYGSDLLGPLQVDQSREFLLRREVLSPIEIIRQQRWWAPRSSGCRESSACSSRARSPTSSSSTATR